MGATEHAVTRSHTTERGCVVTVRAVGPSVEIVVQQYDGRGATYACSHDDAAAIGTMIIAACPRPSEESDDG
jgi:hypothetical protein